MRFLAVVFLTFTTAAAQTNLAVPADPKWGTETRSAIEQARAEGDTSRALREYSKLLELYPNEPFVRAPIYLAMAQLAAEMGDDQKAAAYRSTALAIDPFLEASLPKTEAAGAKRGQAMDQVAALSAMGAQILAQVETIRNARKLAAAGQPAPQPLAAPAMPAAPIGAPGAPALPPPVGLPAPGGFGATAPVIVGYDANNQPIFGPPQTASVVAPGSGGPMSPAQAVLPAAVPVAAGGPMSPALPQPVVAAPPVPTQPVAAPPVYTQPQPIAPMPAAQPLPAQPAYTQPQPIAPMPAVQPLAAQPAYTQPQPIAPTPSTQPLPAQPVYTQPQPIAPMPATQPLPAQPAYTQPQPIAPMPAARALPGQPMPGARPAYSGQPCTATTAVPGSAPTRRWLGFLQPVRRTVELELEACAGRRSTAPPRLLRPLLCRRPGLFQRSLPVSAGNRRFRLPYHHARLR